MNLADASELLRFGGTGQVLWRESGIDRCCDLEVSVARILADLGHRHLGHGHVYGRCVPQAAQRTSLNARVFHGSGKALADGLDRATCPFDDIFRQPCRA